MIWPARGRGAPTMPHGSLVAFSSEPSIRLFRVRLPMGSLHERLSIETMGLHPIMRADGADDSKRSAGGAIRHNRNLLPSDRRFGRERILLRRERGADPNVGRRLDHDGRRVPCQRPAMRARTLLCGWAFLFTHGRCCGSLRAWDCAARRAGLEHDRARDFNRRNRALLLT